MSKPYIWPRAKDQVALDNRFATWRFIGTPRWSNELGYRQNLKFALGVPVRTIQEGKQ